MPNHHPNLPLLTWLVTSCSNTHDHSWSFPIGYATNLYWMSPLTHSPTQCLPYPTLPHPPLPPGLAPPPRPHTCIQPASMPMHSSPGSAYPQHHLQPFYGHPHMHDDIMQPLPWLHPLALPMFSAMPFGPACPWTYDIHSSSAPTYAWCPWHHLWPCAPHDVTMHHLRLMASPMTCPSRCHPMTPWYYHMLHNDIIQHHYVIPWPTPCHDECLTSRWHHYSTWYHPDFMMTHPCHCRGSAKSIN